MKCKFCGKKIPDDAVYCAFCGNSVLDKNAGKKNKNMKKKLGIAGAIISCMIVATVLGFVFIPKLNFRKLISPKSAENNTVSDSASQSSQGEAEDDSQDVLKKYSESITCNYGKQYAQYLSHDVDAEEYEYDCEDSLKGQNLGKLIYDFDGDGANELLTLSLNENANLLLSMYEQDGEDVSLASSINLTDDYGDEAFTILKGATGNSIFNPGIIDCYIYEHDGANIVVQVCNSEGLIGDGMNLDFVDFKYTDQALNEELYYTDGGDDFFEDEDYVDDIALFGEIGINVENYNSLMNRGMSTQDGIDHVREVVHCRLFYNDINSYASEMIESGFDDLRTGYYNFASENELRNDLAEASETSSDNPCYQHTESDSPQDIYRKFLINGDYYNQVGSYNSLAYAIRDVNGDDIPELIILKDYYTYMDLSDNEPDGNAFFYKMDDSGEKIKYVGDLRSMGANVQYNYDDPQVFFSADECNLAIYAQYSDFATYSFFTVKPSCLLSDHYIGYIHIKSGDDYVTHFKEWNNSGQEQLFATCQWGSENEEEAYESFYNRLGDLKKIAFTDISYVAGINDQTKAGLVDFKESYGPVSEN